MLAEAIAKLVELGQKAKAIDLVAYPLIPGKVFLRHGEELREIDVPPPARKHVLRGYDDLIAALKDAAIAKAPEVYVGPKQIVALLDREYRRETVTVDLVESARWRKVMELQQPRGMQPKEAVKMLRLELHGGGVSHVIQALSRVDFSRTSGGRTDVAHGRESLGRSVEASVQQADKVPEQFTLAVPVWSTHGFARYGVNVEFGLYLDLEAQNVELRVLADEVERARNLALAAVVQNLIAALPGVPVFQGVP